MRDSLLVSLAVALSVFVLIMVAMMLAIFAADNPWILILATTMALLTFFFSFVVEMATSRHSE